MLCPAHVSQARTYAHRAHRSLLVLEFEALNATVGCSVRLASCAGRPNLVTELAPQLYQVTSPEQPFDPAWPRAVPPVTAFASTPLPPTVTLGPDSKPSLFLAVFRTTLETGVTNATVAAMAKAELAARTAEGSAGLWERHTAAWNDVYGIGAGAGGGGIEVAGNATLAGKVNSSLYYLLSSVGLCHRCDINIGTGPRPHTHNPTHDNHRA